MFGQQCEIVKQKIEKKPTPKHLSFIVIFPGKKDR